MIQSKIKTINVSGIELNTDPNYRYKMESVDIRNLGAKIAWTNATSISGSLNRDVPEISKFLKKHFGCQFECKNDMLLTTKKDLTQDTLQNAVYTFIQNNVLCNQCNNPETEYIQDKKKVYTICKACSFKKEKS